MQTNLLSEVDRVNREYDQLQDLSRTLTQEISEADARGDVGRESTGSLRISDA